MKKFFEIYLTNYLSNFRYACLINDGSLIYDNNVDGKYICLQTPTQFEQNQAGMCHDATIFLNYLLWKNNIKHKCVCILTKNNATHSFIIFLNENKKWKVIDPFSYDDCFMNGEYETYSDAADNRIYEWIKNDNKNDPNVDIYINDSIPFRKTLFEFFDAVKSSMFTYYTKNQLNDIYFNNDKILNEEIDKNLKYQMKHANKNACITYENEIIIESTYFNDVPEKLEKYIISKYNDNLNDYWFQVPISKIAKLLLDDKIGNYKCFHNFLNKLLNSDGYVDFKITNGENYFQPPIEISKVKIKSNEKDYLKLLKIESDYEKWLKEKTEVCLDMNKRYAQINDQIKLLQCWGEIGINGIYFIKENDYLKSTLDHELGHFISFLIRVSNENHNLCRYWSNEKMSDFSNDNNGNVLNKKIYMLDSDEFKRWCDTVIQRLCVSFKLNSNNFSNENKNDFYNAIISTSIGENYSIKNPENQHILNNMFRLNDTKDFIKNAYLDSLKKDSIKYRNNFKSFKKWFKNELNKISHE